MRSRTLAHVSDLHVGKSVAQDRATEALVETLLDAEIDHVVVTGDLTHRGRRRELERCTALLAPLTRQGKVSLLPGNHDRVGEDAGEALMGGRRVEATSLPGLYLIRIDSTGPHNRSYFRSHGDLCLEVLRQVTEALDRCPPDVLCAIALHHHVLPLPEESVAEWFASQMGWPHANELALGEELLRRAAGRCDLVLHGHRHTPRAFRLEGTRPMRLYNAGSSSELGRFRVFTHRGGALLREPQWHATLDAPAPLPWTMGIPAADLGAGTE